MEFTEAQLGTISNALRVAAEKFAEDAAYLNDLDQFEALTKQFKKQRFEAMELYTRIEAVKGIAN